MGKVLTKDDWLPYAEDIVRLLNRKKAIAILLELKKERKRFKELSKLASQQTVSEVLGTLEYYGFVKKDFFEKYLFWYLTKNGRELVDCLQKMHDLTKEGYLNS